MDKFQYCGSEDELMWHIEKGKTYHPVYLIDDMLYGRRNEIRTWIENTCSGNVLAWNGTSSPYKGDLDWQKKMAPDGSARLYFTDERDETLFRLKWL